MSCVGRCQASRGSGNITWIYFQVYTELYFWFRDAGKVAHHCEQYSTER